MVDGSRLAAGVVSDDTRLVKLKDKLIRLNGDANRLHGNGGQQGSHVTRWNINKRLDNTSRDIRAVGHALCVFMGNIRIVSFRAQTSTLFVKSKIEWKQKRVNKRQTSVRQEHAITCHHHTHTHTFLLECIVHEPTIAGQIFMITVQQVLFRQWDHFSRFQITSPLQGSGGGKRPTGSARSLILHGRDGPHLDPIDIIWQLQGFLLQQRPTLILHQRLHYLIREGFFFFGGGSRRGHLRILAQFEIGRKFIRCHVRKGIVAKGKGWRGFLLVVGLNAFCVGM